jgi:hypothetical protein
VNIHYFVRLIIVLLSLYLFIYLFIYSLSLHLSLFPSVCQVLFDVTFLVLDRDDETLDLAQDASVSISLSAANEEARP